MMPALSYHLNPFGRDIEVIWEKNLLFFLHWRLNFAFNLLKGKSKYFPCLIASIKVGKSDLGKTNLQSDFNFRLQQLLIVAVLTLSLEWEICGFDNWQLWFALSVPLSTFQSHISDDNWEVPKSCPVVRLNSRIRLLTQLTLVNMRTKARNITKWKKNTPKHDSGIIF